MPNAGLISELQEFRNRWAHQKPLSGDDTYRALDSTHRLLMAVSSEQAAEVEKLKNESLRLRFRGAGPQPAPPRHRSRQRGCHRRPARLARGGQPPPRRGQRPLPAGRVRRRPLAGASGRGLHRVSQPDRVLPPHLPDPKSEGSAGKWTTAPERPGRRARRAVADQLRRRQDALHACPLSPLFRRAARRVGRYRRHHASVRRDRTAARQSRRPRRQPYLARQPGHQAGWHAGMHALGRDCLATRPCRRRPARSARCL